MMSDHSGTNQNRHGSAMPKSRRERRMGRFKSPGQAQRFLVAFEPIQGHFHPHQHKLTATEYRETMRQRFESWHEVMSQNTAV